MSQKEPDGQLTSKQAKFVESLLAGESLEKAAKTASISYSTAKRWQRLSVVQEALRSGQQEMFEASLDRLKRLMPKALDALETHLDAAVLVTAGSQLGAARALIEQNITLHKIADLQSEVDEIRDILKARK